MYLYLLSQTSNNDWDTFDSCVVAAPSAKAASQMTPDASRKYQTWAPPELVIVKYLGVAAAEFTKPQVICASFNAG